MDYQGGIQLIRRSVKDPEINDTKIPTSGHRQIIQLDPEINDTKFLTSGHRQLIQLDLISFGCYNKPLPPFNTTRTNAL